jgi:hypothetical protein
MFLYELIKQEHSILHYFCGNLSFAGCCLFGHQKAASNIRLGSRKIGYGHSNPIFGQRLELFIQKNQFSMPPQLICTTIQIKKNY